MKNLGKFRSVVNARPCIALRNTFNPKLGLSKEVPHVNGFWVEIGSSCLFWR